MSNIMAGFGEGFVETQIMSENNAVRYKLSVAAGLKSSAPSNEYILLQDKPLGEQGNSPGMNVREINLSTNTVISRKIFDFKNGELVGANKSFVDYMTSLVAKDNTIIVLSTGDRLYSSETVDNWFKSVSSPSWPGTWMCSKYPCSYVAFYSVHKKKIIQEHTTYSDGVLRDEDVRAQLEVVYDKFDDIGATGFVKRAIEEVAEASSDTEYEFKRYPSGAPIIALMKDYSITPGSKLKASFELFADKALLDSGQSTRLNFRWFKGSTILTSQANEVPIGQSDRWIKYERYIDVPATADGFTVIAARYPRQDTSVGVGAVRNLILLEVSRQDEAISRSAEFGVNGIRMNKAIDGQNSELLILPDTKDDPSGEIRSAEFREYAKTV
ncbi:hinge connector of long tail fiber proximal connector [Serratia phage vB_SspM_LC53]|nr:hinge connector of long tail fiber proximal connector [Serratia phage vB_SspM_LC53]